MISRWLLKLILFPSQEAVNKKQGNDIQINNFVKL